MSIVIHMGRRGRAAGWAAGVDFCCWESNERLQGSSCPRGWQPVHVIYTVFQVLDINCLNYLHSLLSALIIESAQSEWASSLFSCTPSFTTTITATCPLVAMQLWKKKKKAKIEKTLQIIEACQNPKSFYFYFLMLCKFLWNFIFYENS